jgi:hypothetical protein
VSSTASAAASRPFEEHPRTPSDLVADTGGELSDVEGRREVVAGDGVGDVDRHSDVDQVVVCLLLIHGRRSLAPAAPQPANVDPSGELVHDPAGGRVVSLRNGMEVAPYPTDG